MCVNRLKDVTIKILLPFSGLGVLFILDYRSDNCFSGLSFMHEVCGTGAEKFEYIGFFLLSFGVIYSLITIVKKSTNTEDDSHNVHEDHIRRKIQELDNYIERRRKPDSETMEQLSLFLSEFRSLKLNDNKLIDDLDREYSEKLCDVDKLPS